jgi:hypothetical protein
VRNYLALAVDFDAGQLNARGLGAFQHLGNVALGEERRAAHGVPTPARAWAAYQAITPMMVAGLVMGALPSHANKALQAFGSRQHSIEYQGPA